VDSDSFPEIDPALYRTVLGHFATGVTVITAMDGEEPVGMAANSFTSVSLEPPLVLFCPGKSSSTWPKIQRAKGWCVNILAEDQEEVCRLMAQKGAERFREIGWKSAPSGAPVLAGTVAHIDCRTVAEHDAGDHLIVVGRVLEMGVNNHEGPLLFFRGGYGQFAV
jgi:3-hydroxy-9,10-secoandrosta-1,3,5(10)-triene-9,17-dione monooxygenase reductase component